MGHCCVEAVGHQILPGMEYCDESLGPTKRRGSHISWTPAELGSGTCLATYLINDNGLRINLRVVDGDGFGGGIIF